MPVEKGRLPQKRRTPIDEVHEAGWAPTAASLLMFWLLLPWSTREGSHRLVLPPSLSLPLLPPPSPGPTCPILPQPPPPPDDLAHPSCHSRHLHSWVASLPWSIAPLPAGWTGCSSSLQSRKLMGQPHAEVGLKPQLGPCDRRRAEISLQGCVNHGLYLH